MILKLGKFLATLFLIYISWYYGAIGPNNTILYVLALGTTLCTVTDLLVTKSNIQHGLSSLIPMYFVFGIYCLISGFIVAANPQYLGSSLTTYFAFTIICFDVCYISQKLKSADWIVSGFIVCAIFCAVQTLLWGKNYINNGVTVLTMGPDNNPNTLGLTLLFGIFGIVNSRNYNKHFYRNIALAIVFLYVIILTGSRKSFLSGVGLMLLWVVMYIRHEAKNSGSSKILGRVAFIGLAIVIALGYVSKNFEGTSMYARLTDSMGNNQSDQNRLRMYEWAVELWKNNVIFGVGYDQYRLYYGVYSHSTYAELLACSGIVGCLIWLVTLWKNTLGEFRRIRRVGHSTTGYHISLNMVMLFIELVMGLGNIWFYEFTHMLMLTYIFMYGKLAERQEINSTKAGR